MTTNSIKDKAIRTNKKSREARLRRKKHFYDDNSKFNFPDHKAPVDHTKAMEEAMEKRAEEHQRQLENMLGLQLSPYFNPGDIEIINKLLLHLQEGNQWSDGIADLFKTGLHKNPKQIKSLKILWPIYLLFGKRHGRIMFLQGLIKPLRNKGNEKVNEENGCMDLTENEMRILKYFGHKFD